MTNNLLDLIALVPLDKPVLFACIGTDRSTGDSLGPLVGTFLLEKGYEVIGTLENPMHAMSIPQDVETIKERYPNHFVIAIDAALGSSNRIGMIVVEKGPLLPGKAVKKKLPPIGDVSIKGIVNIGGFMEYTVLSNTRLFKVWEMAKEITMMCEGLMQDRESASEVATS